MTIINRTSIFFIAACLSLLAAPASLAQSNSSEFTSSQQSDSDELANKKFPQESVFSSALRFQGDVVDELPSGQKIRQTAYMHGKRFEWVGKLDQLRASDERPSTVERAPDIDAISVEELAANLRGIAFFQGNQFIEATPPLKLAIEVKQRRALEQQGLSEDDLARMSPGSSGSQGTATRTEDIARVEQGESTKKDSNDLRSVHGNTDDRYVLNNRSYPHRTQIVFDNSGSNYSINGAQGSGTLIGPSTAMSVAHVFWDEGANTWESTHRWAPGYDYADSSRSPYGEWYGCYWVTIPTAYTTYESAYYDFAVLDFNVGCNSVRDGVNSDRPGSSVGWLGAYTASESAIESRRNYVRGYPATGTCGNPGVSCSVRVWGDSSSASETNATSTTIRHQADTSGGQSGSAIYHYADPSCSGCGYGAYLVGMHRAGSSSYNLARRYNSTVSSFMRAYSDDY